MVEKIIASCCNCTDAGSKTAFQPGTNGSVILCSISASLTLMIHYAPFIAACQNLSFTD